MASFNKEGSLQIDPTHFLPTRQSAIHLTSLFTHAFHRLRRNRLNVLLIPLACFFFLWAVPLSPPLPPSYKREWGEERWLPQMAFDGTMEGDGQGRFVK